MQLKTSQDPPTSFTVVLLPNPAWCGQPCSRINKACWNSKGSHFVRNHISPMPLQINQWLSACSRCQFFCHQLAVECSTHQWLIIHQMGGYSTKQGRMKPFWYLQRWPGFTSALTDHHQAACASPSIRVNHLGNTFSPIIQWHLCCAFEHYLCWNLCRHFSGQSVSLLRKNLLNI